MRPQTVATAVACAWWCLLGTASLLLAGLAPAGILHGPLGAGLILLCTELAVLAIAILLVSGLSALLARLRRPVPPALGWTGRALRVALAGLALLAFAASWGSFWYTGHFLDREAVGFALGDLRTVLGYAAGMNGALFLGIGALALASGAAASEVLPRWIARCRPLALSRFTRATAAAAAACMLVALGGNALRGHDLAGQRDFSAGPSTRLLADLLERPAGPTGSEGAVPRRPITAAPLDVAGMDRMNVLVILVDSLRADMLGGTRPVMPAVEALAREGRVYTDCLTTATHTDYAAPSALSSHYPLRSRTSHLCPPNPSYPRVLIYDLLKQSGYRTALFSSQDEHWRQMNRYLDTGSLDRYFHAASVPGRSRAGHPEGTIDDGTTVDEALQWITGAHDAPFFACLNLQNAHAPYPVPAGFERPFGPARRDFPISFGWFPAEHTAAVKALYTDSLAYVDQELGRLFRDLRDRGLWERTIVVVTADHGESFYEHGLVAHGGPLYAEQTHVPLIVRVPGLAPGSDPRPAQILDIPPTLCHALGLRPHPSFQGVDLLAKDAPPERSRFLVVQTPFARQYAIVRGDHKLIYDSHRRKSLLFDLASDPAEENDLAAAEPGRRADLESRLASWYRAQVEYYEDRSRHAAEYPPAFP